MQLYEVAPQLLGLAPTAVHRTLKPYYMIGLYKTKTFVIAFKSITQHKFKRYSINDHKSS
jgi:hypothetical protein